jgi:hypothetical protein
MFAPCPLVLKCPLICLKTSPSLVLPFPLDFVRFPKIETTSYKRKMLTVIETAQTNRTTLFKRSHPGTLLTPTELYTRVECALSRVPPTVCGGPSQAGCYAPSGFRISEFDISGCLLHQNRKLLANRRAGMCGSVLHKYSCINLWSP